jgi:5'-methylthioadenosine phosphorylase
VPRYNGEVSIMIKCDRAVITGSGFYDFPDLTDVQQVEIATPYGKVQAVCGDLGGKSVLFIARHKQDHALLSNMINHRANIYACQEAQVGAIIATSIVGIMTPDLPLAKILVFNDIFYPDNRLPDGSSCTFYTEEGQAGRGHYIFGSPFFDVSDTLKGSDIITGLTYAYVNGPRLNSQKEIAFLTNYADAVSQTAGPEAVLAGELEIPYVLLGYGVDYANGVRETPTPIEVLTENMHSSKAAFAVAISQLVSSQSYSFGGFVYRFD